MTDELDFLESLSDEIELITDDSVITKDEETLINEGEEENDSIIDEEASEEKLKKDLNINEEEEDSADDEDESEEDESDDKKKEVEKDPSDYFKVIVEGLGKLGKFGEVPTDVKWDEKTFINHFEKVSEKNAINKIEEILKGTELGEKGIEFFNDIFIKRVNAEKYLTAFSQMQDYDSIDLENKNNQKLVIRDYLKLMGQDDEEVLEQLEFFESKNKLEELSVKYKNKLIENSKAELKRISDEKELDIKNKAKSIEERNSKIKENLENSLKNKEVLGLPLSLKDNVELLPYLTEPAYQTKNGEYITEAQKDLMELQRDPLKMIALAKLMKSNFDLGAVKNKAVEEKEEEVFNFKPKEKKKSFENKDLIDLLLKNTKHK